jgi:glyoxylase-like metal-dependent hydrolase (beta-lactamase superfamily II)/ferredoxin
MANPTKQVPENVPGDFFVDSTCIDCDTCRQIAPDVFAATRQTAFVHHQPCLELEYRGALRALVSCPTGSIGSRSHLDPKPAMLDFPLVLEDPVYYCGFNSSKSYGGNSYFIRHRAGNWLIDSPKYLPQLVKQFEALGGISKIFLTHRDDVADADHYASHFGSQRDAELILEGDNEQELADDFVVIPTPGHTAGHCALLFNRRFLFTGDHLYYDRQERRLAAFKGYCWDSWSMQTESMGRLMDYHFEWVLPGHGQRVWLPAVEMRTQLSALVDRMQANRG